MATKRNGLRIWGIAATIAVALVVVTAAARNPLERLVQVETTVDVLKHDMQTMKADLREVRETVIRIETLLIQENMR